MTTQITHYSIHPKNGKIVPGLFNSMQEAFREVKRLGFGLKDVEYKPVIENIKIKKEKVKSTKINKPLIIKNIPSFYLNLELLPEIAKKEIMEKYPQCVELNLSGKERSLLTEQRVRNVLGIEKPKTDEYDLLYLNTRFELKQAEAYLKQPKFQQIHPHCYPYIICMLNHKDKSEWYLLETSKISKKAGKKNVENGKLPLNIQHRGHQTEGQIYPNAAFKEAAIFLGYYEPLFYYKDDLNLSSSSILDIFNKIEEIIK
jgi:hypothetical protein